MKACCYGLWLWYNRWGWDGGGIHGGSGQWGSFYNAATLRSSGTESTEPECQTTVPWKTVACAWGRRGTSRARRETQGVQHKTLDRESDWGHDDNVCGDGADDRSA